MARTIAIILAVLATIVAVLIWLLVSSFRDTDTGYRVTMRPSAPLSHAACKAQIRRLRMTLGDFDCSPGKATPWFEITITNVHDRNGFPVCTTTAYDGAGHQLFDRFVPIQMVGGEPSGPQVGQGTRLRLVWYFGSPHNDSSYVRHTTWKAGIIRRYRTSCHGRPQSQVPI